MRRERPRLNSPSVIRLNHIKNIERINTSGMILEQNRERNQARWIPRTRHLQSSRLIILLSTNIYNNDLRENNFYESVTFHLMNANAVLSGLFSP